MDFSDDVVLVTGGTKGIGFAAAKQFAEGGATVLINYHSDDESANNAIEELQQYDTPTEALKFDVAESNEVTTAVQDIFEEYGKISILVNNAGIMDSTLFIRMDDDQWDRVIKTNLYGTFYCSREVGRKMVFERIEGTIVNVSSIAGHHGFSGQSSYGASKAAISHLTRVLSQELGGRNICVNAVVPGLATTDMYFDVPEEATDYVIESAPLGRPADPEEVANVITFVASEKASYMNGSVVRVDGGFSS